MKHKNWVSNELIEDSKADSLSVSPFVRVNSKGLMLETLALESSCSGHLTLKNLISAKLS